MERQRDDAKAEASRAGETTAAMAETRASTEATRDAALAEAAEAAAQKAAALEAEAQTARAELAASASSLGMLEAERPRRARGTSASPDALLAGGEVAREAAERAAADAQAAMVAAARWRNGALGNARRAWKQNG